MKRKKTGELHIGTSGWAYNHWNGIFYPQDLAEKDRLKFLGRYFKTTEINYSFYRLPSPAAYCNWRKQTPKDFVFSVKASRFITHIKRLKDIKESWDVFLGNALNLKEKLGPILLQFPASFKATEENTKRLEEFLALTQSFNSQSQTLKASLKIKRAFEFRHQSWCDKEYYNLLKKYNAAWVIADSPDYPRVDITTADFVYIRMHGSKILFGSDYTKQELNNLASGIKRYLKQGLDVYIYFNNDAYSYAVKNAKELLLMFDKERMNY